MTIEKALQMIDEYLMEDNINAEWVECLKLCKGLIEELNITRSYIYDKNLEWALMAYCDQHRR